MDDSELQDFDPTGDAYYSSRNSYNIDIDDAGVAINGFKSQDHKICKFYLLGRKCAKSVFCEFAHPSPKEINCSFQQIYNCANNVITEVSSDQIYAIKVTAVNSPIEFYANLTPAEILEDENGCKHLVLSENVVKQRKELFDAMQMFYKSEVDRYGYNVMRSLGELVAANPTNDDGRWRRAKVTNVNELVEVFYVDFGEREWLEENQIRNIVPQFTKLGFQAHHCVLANLSINLKADKEAGTEFLSKKTLGRTLHGRSAYMVGETPALLLYDITDPEYELFINDAIMFKGFAIQEPQKINLLQEPFLEPG